MSSGTTACASISGTTSTLGIHGLRCISEVGLTVAKAAVYLDGSNNSIEDVFVDGFYDGVLVGSQHAALSNVLTNIVGDTSRNQTVTTPVNTVHISSLNTVQELSILGMSNSGSPGTYTLEDELTGAHLTDASVALYTLGKAVTGAGYARLTTSPSVPTWASGSTPPTGSTCVQGSLFSCNGASTCNNNVLWGCQSGTGWAVIK